MSCALFCNHSFKKKYRFSEKDLNLRFKKNENISVNAWFIRLKNKARKCQFSAQLDNMITDKFVTNLGNGPILDKVTEEKYARSLNDILKTVKKREATILQNKLEPGIRKLSSNKKINRNEICFNKDTENNPNNISKSNQEQKTCKHCVGTRHDFNQYS